MRPDKLDRFAKMWNAGVPVARMAREFQMSEVAVRNLAARNRDLCDYRKPRRCALPDEQIERIRRARSAGASARDLAKAYGVHHTTIRRYCKGCKEGREEGKSVYDLLMDFAYNIDYMGNCPSEMIEDMAINLARRLELK